MGDGAMDAAELTDLVRAQAKRLILFDMEAVAEQHHSVISSVMLGALCGSGVLPFARKKRSRLVIRSSGIAVANQPGRVRGCVWQRGGGRWLTAGREHHAPSRGLASSGGRRRRALRSCSRCSIACASSIRRFRHWCSRARGAQSTIRTRRTPRFICSGWSTDRCARSDSALRQRRQSVGAHRATARSLALWMTFEDTIRVADLKTRAARFARVRDEIRADPDQLFGITEFMKPRVAEIAGHDAGRPGALGAELAADVADGWRGGPSGKQIRTSTISGFLLLHSLAGMQPLAARHACDIRKRMPASSVGCDESRSLAASHYALGCRARARAAAGQRIRRYARARLAEFHPHRRAARRAGRPARWRRGICAPAGGGAG